MFKFIGELINRLAGRKSKKAISAPNEVDAYLIAYRKDKSTPWPDESDEASLDGLIAHI